MLSARAGAPLARKLEGLFLYPMKMRQSNVRKYKQLFDIDYEGDIQTLIVEKFGILITCLSEKLIDHGLDSLDFVELNMGIEDKYDFEISDDDLEERNIRAGNVTIEMIAKYIKELKGA